MLADQVLSSSKTQAHCVFPYLITGHLGSGPSFLFPVSYTIFLTLPWESLYHFLLANDATTPFSLGLGRPRRHSYRELFSLYWAMLQS